MDLVNLSELAKTAFQSAFLSAKEKKIDLELKLEAKKDFIWGDFHRLQQVINNLLSNAIKFTPQAGKVVIRVREIDSHVALCVEDTGAGIDPDFLPFVFERFKQEDSSTSRRHGGLGLGLAIAKQLVELHKGNITAFSEGKDKGTCFTAAFPIAHDVYNVIQQTDATADGGDEFASSVLNGKNILIVDDAEDVLDLVGAVLTQSGARVTSALTARDGFSKLEKEPFDVIVSDIGMPDEDGYHFMERIRAWEKNQKRQRTPAVALTAYTRADEKVKAIESGFDFHLGKPFEPWTLIDLIGGLSSTK